MKSVLHGFLGTYTSRYSDFRGYWLHGQLLSDPRERTLDLLGPPPGGDSAAEAACRLAVRRFAEQLHKSGLSADVVHEAALRIVVTPQVVDGRQGDHAAKGFMVLFSVRSVTDDGRVYHDERTLFVAPHDPAKERRRHEDHWGA